MTEMKAESVGQIYRDLCELGVHIWVDGGWSVDAVLGEQTRPHADLDVAVQVRDLDGIVDYLTSSGYGPVARDDTRSWNFVLGDPSGNLVDIHVIDIDENGDGIYGPPENGEMYPAGSLTGQGIIAGHHVRCIAAEFLVQFHTGYPIADTDIHDVTALCHRFGIPLPEEYVRVLGR